MVASAALERAVVVVRFVAIAAHPCHLFVATCVCGPYVLLVGSCKVPYHAIELGSGQYILFRRCVVLGVSLPCCATPPVLLPLL